MDKQQDIVLLKQEVEPIEQRVSSLIITDERSSKLATDYGAYISTVIKKADDLRKAINEPYEKYIDENNAKFFFIKTLKELKEAIRTKIMTFIEAERIRQKKEAEEKQKEIDKISEKNGLPKIEVSVEEKRSITSGIGKSFTMKKWDFELVDFAKVPDEFKMLDETKIRHRINETTKNIKGVSECSLKIEGIKIYQKENVSFRK